MISFVVIDDGNLLIWLLLSRSKSLVGLGDVLNTFDLPTLLCKACQVWPQSCFLLGSPSNQITNPYIWSRSARLCGAVAAHVCFHCLIFSAEMSSRLSYSSLALSSALASLRNLFVHPVGVRFCHLFSTALNSNPCWPAFHNWLFVSVSLAPPHPTPHKRTNLNYVIGLVLQVLLLLSHLIGSLVLFGRLNFGHIYSFVTIREFTLLGL